MYTADALAAGTARSAAAIITHLPVPALLPPLRPSGQLLRLKVVGLVLLAAVALLRHLLHKFVEKEASGILSGEKRGRAGAAKNGGACTKCNITQLGSANVTSPEATLHTAARWQRCAVAQLRAALSHLQCTGNEVLLLRLLRLLRAARAAGEARLCCSRQLLAVGPPLIRVILIGIILHFRMTSRKR